MYSITFAKIVFLSQTGFASLKLVYIGLAMGAVPVAGFSPYAGSGSAPHMHNILRSPGERGPVPFIGWISWLID